MTTDILVEVAPKNRLLEEDLKSELQKQKYLRLVNTEQEGEKIIRVSELEFETHENPPRTQTIIYKDYQVNVLGAVLLMPQYATYQYEYTEGFVDINYAYEIKVYDGAVEIDDHLLRIQKRQNYSRCDNARIQNVYGGTQPATFVANDDMKNRCGGTHQPLSPNSVRHQAIVTLATTIAERLNASANLE